MKNFIYFILIMLIGFTSCDGRKSKRQTFSENIESFKKKNTIVIDTYSPEKDIKREVDTTLSNGFHVKIKTQTNPNEDIVLSKINDGITYSENHKSYTFSIDIKRNNFKIYHKTFNRQHMMSLVKLSQHKSSENLPDDFNRFAVLQSIQLNQELSIEKDSVYIDIAYAKPNDTYMNWHTLKIDKDGTSEFIQFIN